jgi:uncharacterized protein (TIGR02646 family)
MSGPLPGGQQLADDLEARRQADPDDGASRERAFRFRKATYGSSKIKKRLAAAQHDKCCYCEGRFTAFAPGDVEHFRPKTCVQQLFGHPLCYPGYFWLAYDWENLLFACIICNRSAKKSQFPLEDPNARLSGPADPFAQENPMLINPLIEDPGHHIRFEHGRPIAITERGQLTIDVLKLDRGELKYERLTQLKHVQALIDIISLAVAAGDEVFRQSAQDELDFLASPEGPFSALVRGRLAEQG